MKKIRFLLIVLFGSVVFCLPAKDRYVMAQIIMSNNDTLVNPIRYDNLFDFQKKIDMLNDDEKLQPVYPKDAKGFYVIAGEKDTLYFESVCGLILSLSDNTEANCFFLMKKCAGKFPVYYFAQPEMVSTGYAVQSTYRPVYIVRYKDNWVLFRENNYVNQLLKFLKPLKKDKSPELVKKLQKLEDDIFYRTYLFDDIPSAFIRLNELFK